MKYNIKRLFENNLDGLWDWLVYYDPTIKGCIACSYNGGNFIGRYTPSEAKTFNSLRTAKTATKRLTAYWGLKHQLVKAS